MKLLELDSKLSAHKQLADELLYSGDKEDSAAMNSWLHKQVMVKLAENGGVVPDSGHGARVGSAAWIAPAPESLYAPGLEGRT